MKIDTQDLKMVIQSNITDEQKLLVLQSMIEGDGVLDLKSKEGIKFIEVLVKDNISGKDFTDYLLFDEETNKVTIKLMVYAEYCMDALKRMYLKYRIDNENQH